MSIKVEDLRDLENLNKGIRSLIQINMSDKIVSENERTRNLQEQLTENVKAQNDDQINKSSTEDLTKNEENN